MQYRMHWPHTKDLSSNITLWTHMGIVDLKLSTNYIDHFDENSRFRCRIFAIARHNGKQGSNEIINVTHFAMGNCFRSDVAVIVHLIQLKVLVCPFWPSLALAIRMYSLSASASVCRLLLQLSNPSQVHHIGCNEKRKYRNKKIKTKPKRSG